MKFKELLIVSVVTIACVTWIWYCADVQSASQLVVVICDVEEQHEDSVDVVMPNGSIHTYTAYDLPEECGEVALVTEDQDDYTKYEVIGAR